MKKLSIFVAAVLAAICFVLGDMISMVGFSVFTNGFGFFFLVFRVALQSLLGTSIHLQSLFLTAISLFFL